MNIYAKSGHKVVCHTLSAGYPADRDYAARYLQIGEVYTIEKTIVEGGHTDVFLQELPNRAFNSVFFEDVYEQDKEASATHPDYQKYN